MTRFITIFVKFRETDVESLGNTHLLHCRKTVGINRIKSSLSNGYLYILLMNVIRIKACIIKLLLL